MTIYLDFNASTPVAPEVREAMRPFSTAYYGNPHTRHWAGRPAGDAIERARAQVASAIGCPPDEVYFTSGASEANNWAIKGLFFANRNRGDHLITTTVEHPSVRNTIDYLRDHFGAKVTHVPVDSLGRVNPEHVAAAITPRTILVSVMHANNEVGTIQPIAEIGRITRQRGIHFHCDAAQSLGKIPVHVRELDVDLLSIAGHKLYAPKGIGALYIRRDSFGDFKLDPLIHGAGQEQGMRGGTENVEFIVGLGAACALASSKSEPGNIQSLRDFFWTSLQSAFGERVRLHGHPTERLPNTLNVGFRGLVGTDLLEKLDGVAASPGSACHYGDVKLSPTLAAMNVDPEYGMGAIRWSLGRATTRDELDEVVRRLRLAIGK